MRRVPTTCVVTWVIAVLAAASGSAMAEAQATKAAPQPRPWNWQAEQELEKAMQADGLGRSITIEAPVLPWTTVERVRLRPTVQWGHAERHGDALAPLAPDHVSATWTTSFEFVGRLVIEGVFNRIRCRFEGGIAADRVTVTGESDCGGQRGVFRARINRPGKP